MNEPADKPLVEFKDVSFSHASSAVPIISQLNFSVHPGETLVLLGESGCGKTTTLKLINRLLLPSAGEVIVERKPTTAWDPISLRRRTGYVIQDGGLFPHFTVARNVALVPSLEGWDEARIKNRVNELLSLVGLAPEEFAQRYPAELSGGQRQRVGVARVPALAEVLGKLAHAISTDEMRQLNYEVDANKRGQAEVVREWLKKKGF